MNAYRPDVIPVFAGPSLCDWEAHSPFVRRPPAAALDLLRLLAQPPCTLVLIDGLFDARRSVWHKEILHLMSRGFRVIGAASMGALRAAELAPFGMIGVGPIFQAFASGRLVADDEVAVLHAPSDYDWSPLTLAQVDVRATLVLALRRGVMKVGAARVLRDASAAIHYRDRTWNAVMSAGARHGLDLGRFEPWVALGHPSRKAADARMALALALDLAPLAPRPGPAPPVTDFLRVAAQGVGVRLAAD
jgi:hypothetical protein